MHHVWQNTFFRGKETRCPQVCKNCGLIKENNSVPVTYVRDGITQYSAGICTTKGIEQLCDEAVHASKQTLNNQYF